MPDLNLEKEFGKRGPWVTRFVIDGKDYGGDFDPSADPRIRQFFESFPTARDILELGSLEGGHTLHLSRHPTVARVLGIEARSANLKRATFIKELLGITNIEFMAANLEKIELQTLGKFDAVFCSGVLYHLPEPWKLINQFSGISQNLFIWTHYADEHKANEVMHGYKGKIYKEAGLPDPLSGLSRISFWPTLDSLIRMLTLNGYQTIHILENNLNHPHGPSVTIAATSSW